MTREEAFHVIDTYCVPSAYPHTERWEILQKIKEALEVLKQEPCSDAISRQAVLDLIADYDLSMGQVVRGIHALPPVNPQGPNTGHWIIKDGKEQGYDIAGVKTWYIQIMCDKCGFIKTAIEGHTGQYNYCPNCGAKMESEARNETDN